MADFRKPPGSSVERWTEGLKRQEIVYDEFEFIMLYGGDYGIPLNVSTNDPSVVEVLEQDKFGSDTRIFKLTGLNLGNAMIEAKDRYGGVSAFIQISVVPYSPIKRVGPWLGKDGSIPSQYVKQLQRGVDSAWSYVSVRKFRRAYAKLVQTTGNTGKRRLFINMDSFAMALNRMVINYMDTSTNVLVKLEMSKETASDWIAGFTNPTDISQVYIRSLKLDEAADWIGFVIIHESFHVSGMPGDDGSEWASAFVEKDFGIKRYKTYTP